MISQLIEQAQAFLIMQQDSVLFVARESGETFIKQIDLPSLIRAMSQSDFQSNWYVNPLMKLHHISQREGRTTTISSIPPSTYLLKFGSFSLGVPLPGAVIVHYQSQLWVYAYKALRQQTDKKQRWTYNQNYLTRFEEYQTVYISELVR